MGDGGRGKDSFKSSIVTSLTVGGTDNKIPRVKFLRHGKALVQVCRAGGVTHGKLAHCVGEKPATKHQPATNTTNTHTNKQAPAGVSVRRGGWRKVNKSTLHPDS